MGYKIERQYDVYFFCRRKYGYSFDSSEKEPRKMTLKAGSIFDALEQFKAIDQRTGDFILAELGRVEGGQPTVTISPRGVLVKGEPERYGFTYSDGVFAPNFDVRGMS